MVSTLSKKPEKPMSVMELSVNTLSEAMDAAITTPRNRIQ
jgi:hypothetical protein